MSRRRAAAGRDGAAPFAAHEPEQQASPSNAVPAASGAGDGVEASLPAVAAWSQRRRGVAAGGRCVVTAAATALVLGLYVGTLSPSVVGGDSGEIVVAAWKLVFAHPPGYPLITLVGHVFCHYVLPFGEPAWRMGVLNALFATATFALLVRLLEELTGCAPAALAAGLLYALSPLVWQYATTPEVFALNNMFTALIIKLLVSFVSARSDTERLRHARLGVLVCGLAVSNQHTIVLLVLPVGLFVAVSLRRVLLRQPRELAVWLAAFALGLSPYLVLAVLSQRYGDELYSWGDTTTWRGLVTHVLRKEYGTFDLISGFERSYTGILRGLLLYLTTTSAHSLHLAFPCVAGVLAHCVRSGGRGQAAARSTSRSRADPAAQPGGAGEHTSLQVSRVVLFAWAGYVAFFHWRSNLPLDHALYRGVLKRFYMQPNLLLSVVIGRALAFAFAAAAKSDGKRKLSGRAWPWLASGVIAVVQVWAGWEAQSLNRGNTAIRAYARSLLVSLPRDALLLTKGDLSIYPTRYLQACLGVRPDVIVMDQEVMGYDWYIPRVRRRHARIVFPPGERLRPVGKPGRCLRFAPTTGVAVDTASASSGVRKRKGSDDMCEAFEGVFNLQQLFAANRAAAASGRLFILDPKSGDDSFAVDFRLEPHALAQAVVPSSTPLPADADAWAGRLQGLLDSFARPVLGESERFRDGESWEALVFAEAAEGFHRRALHLLQLASAGSDAGLQSRFLQAAVEGFEGLLLDESEMRVGGVRRRLARVRTWQACKNAGVGAEKAWRQAVEGGAREQSARLARLMLLFFGHYLAADRCDEDVQLPQAKVPFVIYLTGVFAIMYLYSCMTGWKDEGSDSCIALFAAY